MTEDRYGIDLAQLADEEAKEVEVGFPDYGLTENPFPTSAIATKTRLFLDIGSKFRLNTFREIAKRIVHTARTGRYRGTVILGDFGLGKTHTLYYFTEIINRQLGDKKGVKSLALYLHSPGTNLYDFLSNFLQEIDTEFILAMVYTAKREIILDIVEKAWKKRLEGMKGFPYHSITERIEELLERLEKLKSEGPDLNAVRMIMKDMYETAPMYYTPRGWEDELDICRKIADLLVEEQIFTLEDYAFCFSVLLLLSVPELQRIAIKYTVGGKLLSSEIKRLGLTSNQLSTSDISKRVFPDLLRILHGMGEKYNMIFVFVDEFEKIVLGIKGTKRFEFLEDLRNLIDYNLNQFSLVLGCSTQAYEAVKSTSPAFADRNRDLVDLPRITTIQEGKNLIQPYLNEDRVKDFSGNLVHPFSNEALSIILDQEKGSPRYILEACHKLLNYGLSESSKTIHKKLVEKWYGMQQ